MRLAALMKLPVTYVWTHDSIGLGEDGPTHQPVEHLSALRAIPGLNVVRPADANETAVAWRGDPAPAHRNPAPHGLALTRQNVPTYDGQRRTAANGGYVLAEADGGTPQVILDRHRLRGADRAWRRASGCRRRACPTRVVSMPCVEWFEEQDQAYRDSVLPPAVKARVAVEAGIGLAWHRFVGDAGRIVSLEHFGASADYQSLRRVRHHRRARSPAAARTGVPRPDARQRAERTRHTKATAGDASS